MFAYTGYLDESGTHDGSEVTVMGGLLARDDQWKRFQTKFNDVKKRHGFGVFHTTKFKRKDGDFRGWTNDQCLALTNDLAVLTSFGLTEGVAISLDNATYDVHYKGDARPNKARFDSKYGLCFRMCLYHFIVETLKRKYRKKLPDLYVVLEAGHRNSGDAERIFFEVKKEFSDAGLDTIRTLTLAEKDKSDPLMMADFVAHSTLMINRKARAQNTPLPSSQHVPRGFTGVTHFESTPQGMSNIRADILGRLTRRPR